MPQIAQLAETWSSQIFWLLVFFGITFRLGGTALLIVVVVSMDFMAQVQSHLMSSQYAKLLEKSNLKNYGKGQPTRAR